MSFTKLPNNFLFKAQIIKNNKIQFFIFQHKKYSLSSTVISYLCKSNTC